MTFMTHAVMHRRLGVTKAQFPEVLPEGIEGSTFSHIV